ncbi:MAG: hypothetical protein LBH21_00530, partial [Gracilibacteraceae bacterium]|nr:hypothetical protein [Gracilibacteraceae bacterium]
MLTIGPPPALTAARQTLTVSAAFAEKIKANYLIMAAAFTPEVLLFLLVNPPETPAAAGETFNLVVEQNSRNTHNMVIDIANNIVNRILLEDKSAPSYQDTVYIDMALRKLGVENTSLFMEQVRALRAETLNTRELIRLYRENLTVRREAAAAPPGRERRGATASAPAGGEALQGRGGEYYLHNEIFRRLDTAGTVMALTELARAAVENYTSLSERETRLAEYGRRAETLILNEYRRQVSAAAGDDIFYHRNYYELSSVPPAAAAGEKAALAQAAAAALFQLIGNTLSSRTENYRTERRQWLDLRSGV